MYINKPLGDALSLSRAVVFCQQLFDKIGRAIRLSDSDISGAVTTLPTPAANSIIGWNAAGTALVNYVVQIGTSLVNLAASSGSSQMSAKDGTTAGNVLITGLPFTCQDNTAVSIGFEQNTVQGAGNSYINLVEIKTAAAFQALPVANLSATSGFMVSGCYRT